MTREKYALVAGAMLLIFLTAQVTSLDLGGFGIGLLIIAAIFGVISIVNPAGKDGQNS